ncbi:relaxase/mobilization nuclease domain-containing protein [Listeria seeligeri]|uniref:relaxase/mobilization nuclease domain-containing protein n=1 Tax=Listeria seeligeri TaxID=1640 RepID=UPI00188701C1|nr:relaxase/mobilization nuclease domain-containing protein [Listeria seeligeri]MBF2599164.1 relaxase/mobilization nuclease domain-containing protein [Listeria seeligeri]
MAVTKIWAIKETLFLAIQYIINPNKSAFIHSHACAPQTADLEFELTLQQNNRSGGINKAYHIIQSFKPDETTPEQAHKIGVELIEQHLENKYEYILSTHIDKGHIHNHIIFCASSYVNHKKYNDCKQSYYQLREASDSICAEQGLSIIDPTKNKGISHYEWRMRNEGTSYKHELKRAIDTTIKSTHSYEDFLIKMNLIGYEIKYGKHLAFRAKDQERFTRGKRLGEEYSEENIKTRITHNELLQDRKRKKTNSINQPVSLMIELENNKKAIENKGYEHWAKLHNLKQASKTINQLKKQNIDSINELEKNIIHLNIEFKQLNHEIKTMEKELAKLHDTRKLIRTYQRSKNIYLEYQKTKNKLHFYHEHSTEIMLFKSSQKQLKNFQIEPNKTSESSILKQIHTIETNYKNKQHEFKEVKSKRHKYELLKKNLNITLKNDIPHDKNNKER